MPKSDKAVETLIDIGKQFYDRRWMWGTAGNLSVKLQQSPLEIQITPSGVNKGRLNSSELLKIRDGVDKPYPKGLQPSSETVIHQAIYRALPGCEAVFHVHAMYATLFSRRHGHPSERRVVPVEWMEMLKGVGIDEDEIAEIVIFPNWQDVGRIASDLTAHLSSNKRKTLPVALLYNHGMTAWGSSPEKAKDYLEIMEYVCEYLWRQTSTGSPKG